MRQPQRPESLAQTLARRLRQQGLSVPVEAAAVCATITQMAAGQFVAIRFREGTLTLRVPDAITGAELRAQRSRWVERIRAALAWPSDRPLRIRIVL